MSASPLVNRREVEIEWGDCDAAGIVFYPNYFRIFDASTARLFEAALGEKKNAWTKRFGIVGIPMVDTGARFLKPARFGDVISIESGIKTFRRSSFEVAHTVFNGGDKAIEAHEKRVWVEADPENPGAIRSKPIPDAVIEAFGASRTA